MRDVLLAILLSASGLWAWYPSTDAWSDTCALYGAYYEIAQPCAGINPPNVKFDPDMRDKYMGYYEGGNTIYISPDLSRFDIMSTIVHETVHYLDVNVQGLPMPGPVELICRSEEGAFFIEGVWAGLKGHPERSRINTWWRSYRYCWQWYGPTDKVRGESTTTRGR